MIKHYCHSCGIFTLIDRVSRLCQSCIDEWADAIEMERGYPDDYDRNGVLGADGVVYSDADPGL